MTSHRTLRVAEAVREVVASAILFEVSDPRVKGVTVLSARISADLRSAVVHVSVMGSPSEQKLALRGLNHAAGFLQSRVAARLQTRFTPILTFELDDSVKKSIAMSRLIDQAIADDRRAAEDRAQTATTDADPSVDDVATPSRDAPDSIADSAEDSN
jgi:ribosome-binding factor A